MTSENEPIRILLVGAGLIGERHAKLAVENVGFQLSGILDFSHASKKLAADFECQHFADFMTFEASSSKVDGAIVATPNETHKEFAVELLKHGIPCLIEKPLAASSEDAAVICEVTEKMGVPVLVGHHRRHHTVSRELKSMIEGGLLGTIVGAQLSWMLKKPGDYFAAGDWRTKEGGGPVWLNMIHEIDLLRYFLGEIVEVSAMLSNTVRGTVAEDTGVISMRFKSGALASAIISDTAPSPWHFEGGSSENPHIARTGEDGLRIFGTTASVSFPSMTIWQHKNESGHWGEQIDKTDSASRSDMTGEVALVAQLKNFVGMIRNAENPLVSARDGLQSVRVVEAIHQSAKQKKTVRI